MTAPDDFDMGKMAQSIEDTKQDVTDIKKTLEKWGNIPFRVNLLWAAYITLMLVGIKLLFNISISGAGG